MLSSMRKCSSISNCINVFLICQDGKIPESNFWIFIHQNCYIFGGKTDPSQESKLKPLPNASTLTADKPGVWTQLPTCPLYAWPSQRPDKRHHGHRVSKQNHAGQGWSCHAWTAIDGRIFYTVLPLGVKSQLPGSD